MSYLVRRSHAFFFVLVPLLGLLASTASLFAQVTASTGSIQGLVTDPSGNIIHMPVLN